MGYTQMKNSTVVLAALLALLLVSCADEGRSISSPGTAPEIRATGRMTLQFHKTEVPAGIDSVIATLTRVGVPTIVKAMSMISDSSAEIEIDSVAVGLWHLSVEAKDTAGVVKYAGETDVQVVEGVITNVSLDLLPASTGVGSVQISVKWGALSEAWTDYAGNPVLVLSGGSYDPRGVMQPSVFATNEAYEMVYYNVNQTLKTSSLGIATSGDGISWTRPKTTPIVEPGGDGTWDFAFVGCGPVISTDGTYRLYYHGFSDINSNWNVGLATSTDASTWTKSGSPVLQGTSGWEFQVGAGGVVRIDSLYFMYYVGRNLPNYAIGLATSSDGTTWSKYAGNPILTATESWEGIGVSNPSVIYDGGEFKMVYMNAGGSTTAFGMATSSDGIHWVKSGDNPVFSRSMSHNNWAYTEIAYPSLRRVNGQLRIYYSGYDARSDRAAIGFAYL